ncbi:MAG: hypothetical protein FWD26_11370, partial [Treponema sp.]|nr:hypothetical protein [Treponema sp.]
MKNTIKMIGIAVLAVAIGLSFISCGEQNNNNIESGCECADPCAIAECECADCPGDGNVVGGCECANPCTIEDCECEDCEEGSLPVKTVTVGAQVGFLTEATPGIVTFPITTANIANGPYYIEVTNLPAGVVIQNILIEINNNSGTLTLSTGPVSMAGITTNLTLTLDDVTSAPFTLTINEEGALPEKTVAVGTQVGFLTEGTPGTATFTITTANIANDQYYITVTNLPEGVDTQYNMITISNNSGTFTLSTGPESTAGVTTNLTLTLDGVTSAPFTLTINEPGSLPVKTITVGNQVGTLTAGTAGSVSFPVTTENFADALYIDIAIVANLPSGVTVSGTLPIINNSGTLTLTTSAGTPAAVTNLTLTIDGATSAVFTLTINSPLAKTVAVGTQTETLTAGMPGNVTFPVTTGNIANGSYTATVANLPNGVSVLGQVAINNNSGTLTLTTSAGTPAAVTGNLTLTLDGATSAPFTLSVGADTSPFVYIIIRNSDFYYEVTRGGTLIYTDGALANVMNAIRTNAGSNAP